MSYYQYHVFFCTNQRDDGRESCQDCDAQRFRDYAKKRSKELQLAGKGGVRINTAGCMDRCSDGPVMVVYPQGIWYHYLDEDDIEEIIQQHLIKGQVVDRLKL